MGEISLKDFFSVLKRKKNIIIIITIISVLLTGIISYFVLQPEYKVFTTLIMDEVEKNEDVEGDQRYTNQKLMNNYIQMAKSRLVIHEVKENLKLDIDSKELNQIIEVKMVPETNFLQIEVISKNSELAKKIANEMAIVSIKYAKDIIKIKNIRIVDEAQIHSLASKTSIKTNTIAGGAIGLLLGIILAFVIESLDNTIKTPKDIKSYLDIPTIGFIPAVDGDLIISKEPKSFAAEAYKSLRTDIQWLQTNKKIRSILITSFTPNEENSMISANISVAMAQVGEKVLLVDGNLRKPDIHTIFNIKNKKGLSNVLEENIDYKEAIYTSEKYNNLHILTSGTILSNPVELLDSERMEDFIEKVSDEYDSIILNAPSLGAITDATVISTIVNGTILVCDVGKSNINEVKIGKETLKRVHANILGVILTGLSDFEDDYYRYYKKSYEYYGKE